MKPPPPPLTLAAIFLATLPRCFMPTDVSSKDSWEAFRFPDPTPPRPVVHTLPVPKHECPGPGCRHYGRLMEGVMRLEVRPRGLLLLLLVYRMRQSEESD